MNLGELNVRIGANTTGLNKGLADAKQSIGAFDRSIGDTISNIKTFHLAIAASVTAFARFVKGSMDAVNATTDLAKSLNTSYASLVTFNRAAQLTGVGNATSLLQFFNKALSEAATNGGPAADTLAKLNLSANELLELPVDERVKLFGERFAELIPINQQAAAAIQFFGRQGQTALELLRDTSAITAAKEEMINLGLALSNIDAEVIGAADDEMSIFGQTMKGIGQQIALSLAPAIAELSRLFKEVVIDSGLFRDILYALDVSIRVVIATIRDFWNILNYIPDALGAIVGETLKLIGMIPGFGKFTELGDGLVVNFQRTWQALQGGGALGRTIMGLDDLRDKWYQVGEAAAQAGFVSGGGGERGMNDAERKLLQDKTKAIADSLKTESDLRAEQAVKDIETLRLANQAKLISDQEYIDLKNDYYAKHWKAMWDMEEGANGLRRDQMEQQVLQLQESLLTQEEALMLSNERKLDLLRTAMEMEVITIEEYNAIKLQQEQAFEDELFKIKSKGMTDIMRFAEQIRKKDLQGALQTFGQMTAANASTNKTMFNLNKAAAIATATVDAYAAITGAYKVGARIGGPPVGAAFAAAAGAFSFAQIRSIASQQFNSGGGGGAGGNIAPTVSQAAGGAIPVANVGAAAGGGGGGQVVTINLQGEIFGREQVRGLISQINEAISDGAVLRLT
jgi:hypothetical protein